MVALVATQMVKQRASVFMGSAVINVKQTAPVTMEVPVTLFLEDICALVPHVILVDNVSTILAITIPVQKKHNVKYGMGFHIADAYMGIAHWDHLVMMWTNVKHHQQQVFVSMATAPITTAVTTVHVMKGGRAHVVKTMLMNVKVLYVRMAEHALTSQDHLTVHVHQDILGNCVILISVI